MGSTCASAHVKWRGDAADAARAISRAYGKLGYVRAKKPAEGGKHVILWPGDHYVSIYDSTNADIDGGELKDAARDASRVLGAGAVVTSLYDSDSYEFAVFGVGRQVDLLMTDADAYAGPMKRLASKARAHRWTGLFGRPVTEDAIEAAAGVQSAFAEATLTSLCGLIGLPGGRAQTHYNDFADDPARAKLDLYFTRKALAEPVAPTGEVVLRNHFDPDTSRKLLVYPAAWPMPVGHKEVLNWLLISEGAGFIGGTGAFEVTGPDGLDFPGGGIACRKFHNGQIVGEYAVPKTPEEHTFATVFTPVETAPGSRRYTFEYPKLWVPSAGEVGSTRILVHLQLQVTARVAGEWDVAVTLSPGERSHPLPRARVAAREQGWLPIVTGVNPRTRFDTADRPDGKLPDSLMDVLVQRDGGPRYASLPPADARAAYALDLAQRRERNYRDWLHSVRHSLQRLPVHRLLEQPAVASSVAILRDQGQPTLDLCRGELEAWLRPLASAGATIRVQAERRMTEAFHVGKVRKTLPASEWLADKAWSKCFDAAENYQSVVLEAFTAGAEFPTAGMGVNLSLPLWRSAPGWDEYNVHVLAQTLAKMRGREVKVEADGGTAHLFAWVIDHQDCRALVAPDDMEARLDALAAAWPPLQAWFGSAAWIPRFDRARDTQATLYEAMSALPFFNGVLHEQHCGLYERRMTAGWCANVLRMVTPHMWLCVDLMRQVDRTALERVAEVSDHDGCFRIVKRADRSMEDFELALLPILPIESARVTVLEP